jgi:hypothetical protein
MQQRLIDSCCRTLIDEFTVCFGQDNLDALEVLDNKNKTQIHANATAHGNESSWGPPIDGCVYLKKKVECLASGKGYEECVREGERAYLDYLKGLIKELEDDTLEYHAEIADLDNEITFWLIELAEGRISQAEFDEIWADILDEIDSWEDDLEEARQDIANLKRQTGTDGDGSGVGEGCPSWVRHTFHEYCEWKEFVAEPGGQITIGFKGSGGCGNVTVWEKQEDGTWKRVKIWNWNLPGSSGYQSGNETRRLDVPLSSTGIYRIHNDNSEFTVDVESFNGTQPISEDPSNADEGAGFSVGAVDSSEYEFSEIWTPSYVSSNTNLEGFNLSDVPQFLTPTGVVNYRADYVAGPHNIYWDDMELVLNILTVWQAGTLTINFSSTTTDTSVTIGIDTAGEYHVPLGAVPAPGNNHISFVTTSVPGDLSFTWDAWSLRPLTKLAPRPIIGIERTQDSPLGQLEYVSITIEYGLLEMGSFDFLIAYDSSVLTFTGAEPGQLLPDCEWEYFTYRYGADGNCGDACPSGLLRIIAIAETNNGPFHPSCYGPPDTDPYELATMSFLVTNDRTFECQYTPISFYWGDCGDNSIPSVDSQVVYVSDHVYDFEGTDITDPTFGFPTYFGAQTECTDEGTGEPLWVPHLDFMNGGINVACDSECCGIYTGGISGNANCSPDGKVTLSDITQLINRVYIDKLPLCCEASGNTNGSADCKITLSDITVAIDKVYISKEPVADCMPECE